MEKVQINHNASSTTAIMLAIASSAIAAHVAGARVPARRRVPARAAATSPSFTKTVTAHHVSKRVNSMRPAAAFAASVFAAKDEDDDEWEDIDPNDIEFLDGEFVVEAFDDEAQLAKALCAEVEENAKACLSERGGFSLAVPGGSVAKALAGLKDVKDVDWSKVHLFFVNERVPDGKCYNLAMDTWVKAVNMPEANVHKCDAGGSVEEEAAAYEAQMRTLAEGDDDAMMLDEVNGLPVFDLILLGMGADGHVGSIYPESKALKDETGAAVLGVDMPDKRSVTMSMPLINTAERVVVAASGVKKAETVRAVLEDDESELPGACVDAFSTIFFLDTGAASKLVAYAEEEA